MKWIFELKVIGAPHKIYYYKGHKRDISKDEAKDFRKQCIQRLAINNSPLLSAPMLRGASLSCQKVCRSPSSNIAPESAQY